MRIYKVWNIFIFIMFEENNVLKKYEKYSLFIYLLNLLYRADLGNGIL
jgi:hypothetical protein